MIQPGLSRISALLSRSSLPWRAIHVAGTNGKGSICNYISSMLEVYSAEHPNRSTQYQPLRWGKFTSPHLIDRWDGISINNQTISKAEFEMAEVKVLERNEAEQIDASEFELLTATAFELFSAAHLDVGIVEVGMGGRLDATNILGLLPESDLPDTCDQNHFRAQPLVTAISKIGLDHQAFLGDTIEAIAREKAGIIKVGVPVVYDQSNLPEVKAVLYDRATANGIRPVTFDDLPELTNLFEDWAYLPAEERPGWQRNASTQLASKHRDQNTSVALRSTWLALQQLRRLEDMKNEADADLTCHKQMIARMKAVSEPHITRNHGRQERIVLTERFPGVFDSTKGGFDVLLDGAHNAQSAEVLAKETANLRGSSTGAVVSDSLTWVLAASAGRNIDELLAPLLRPGDSVFAVEFGPVAGMPWVKPLAAQDILVAATRLMDGDTGTLLACGRDVPYALLAAARHGRGSWTVVAGSLYLVGDVHRFLRDSTDRDVQRIIAMREENGHISG